MPSLPLYRAAIDPAWIDYNGHLRDAYYGLIVSHAIDDVMETLGLDAAYRDRTRCTLYTLEMHLHYLHEVKSTDELEVETSILDCDEKRIHVGCRMTCLRYLAGQYPAGQYPAGRISETVATADLMLLHVQQGDNPRGAALPAEIGRRLESLRMAAEAGAAWGPRSRMIEIKRRPAE
jgi:acyl-CoA thioester hydrolase